MPRRTDIQTILIIGAGPIVIGQACEFDYSGVQACKALRAEGCRVILVNSNPATIMTDPDLADVTYVEPLTPEIAEQIIIRERPDALLPTVGGQTGLNLAVELAEGGILERYGVQLIGASLEAIRLAEDRQRFKETMACIGLATPRSVTTAGPDEALALAGEVGYPLLVRPSFTLGGTGGGVARHSEDLVAAVEHGCRQSPVGQVLVEQNVLGWKEFELEVMRDRAGNFVVVCSIENLDPMGVHTGDSITVAPAQTLTDKEYQRLRGAARAILAAVGVETGGSNVQFAVNPADGQMVVIEMNPRVSRSSALASKATGFPIAKIAALLAVGYTLDEIMNDITRVTPASFEPTMDYVVVKLPRWDFKKFPGVDSTLGPQMKSVGEVMAIGRTFQEALGKGVRGLEIGRAGLGPVLGLSDGDQQLSRPTPDRLFMAYAALRAGRGVEEVAAATGYDPWFVDQLAQMAEIESALGRYTLDTLPADLLRMAKRSGFSDAWIAQALGVDPHPRPLSLTGRGETDQTPQGGEGRSRAGVTEADVRALRRQQGLTPVYQRVDTCAAEFEAHTPYLYATYETTCEARPTQRRKVMILGGGPNRIGQGLEFDYCCVQACFALKALGYETIMVNCNPETVSTDYDTADRLYFEPLTLEDVLNIWEVESGLTTGEGRREMFGPVPVIVQFGGQTPLNLAEKLAAAGVPIWGTDSRYIATAEDRGQFEALLAELDIPRPANDLATCLDEARQVAARIGYPVLVRPSFVLGGRAMAVVYDESSLEGYLAEAEAAAPGKPILIDHYLEDSYEVDVDVVGDGERWFIGGVMQHIEEAGVHSGDSACVLPPYKVSAYHLSIIREYTGRLGRALGVCGLMNVQYAIKDDVVYALEVNPRASRTVPFVSKATGVPLARIAAQVMAGWRLADLGLTEMPKVKGFFVKEAVLPFRKFPGVDTTLGPEMRSTGEVMGHAPRFGIAFAKAQTAAGNRLPTGGTVFISVNDFDKGAALKIGRDLSRLGFRLVATHGTAAMLRRVGISVQAINKVSEGQPHILDAMRGGQIDLIINTPLGQTAFSDGRLIRQEATRLGIPLLTTLSAAQAAVNGIRAMLEEQLTVRSLQEMGGRGMEELRDQGSRDRGIGESGNQGIGESGNRGIRKSGNQEIRGSGNQGSGESGDREIRDRGIRESGKRGIGESGNQGIGESGERGIGESGDREISPPRLRRAGRGEVGDQPAPAAPRGPGESGESGDQEVQVPDSLIPDSLIPDSPIPDSLIPAPTSGAITRVPGFRAAGVACGLKESGQPDLALVACDRPAVAAAMFTTNAFKAAPVLYGMRLLSRSHSAIQSVVINAGNANACTGTQGLHDAEGMARLAEAALNLPADSVFVMSTGVIGHPMPIERVEAGIQAAVQALSPAGGADAARAIMTTDLVPKEAFVQVEIGGRPVSIGGMAKGSGMIHPSLRPAPHATMLSLIVTDAAVSADTLNRVLERAVAASFNRVTVDGDTSTNDTVLLLASGRAGNSILEMEGGKKGRMVSRDYQAFEAALTAVCGSLAKQIARDGEGATRLVEIRVRGAASEAEAERAAKTVATSPLVKTAVFGADPNWGRVLAAVGRSGIQVDPARVSLWLGDLQLVDGGEPLPFDKEAALVALRAPEVRFSVDLGLGPGEATVWTCDLSYKYVEINAEYHT